MVPGVRRDGTKVDTAPPEEAGEAKAPIVPVDAPKVGQIGGCMTKSSPIDAAMAWTSELELPASFAIGGSTPKGVPVMEEVPPTPIGSTSTVAMVDPSVGARPSWSLVWSGDDPLTWGRN